MKKCFFIFTVFTAVACSRYPADLEQVLKLADPNRAELEKEYSLGNYFSIFN